MLASRRGAPAPPASRPTLAAVSALVLLAGLGAVQQALPVQAAGGAAGAASSSDGGPAQAFSTFLGGEEWDEAYDVDVDAAGNSYVAGLTTSADLPVRGAVQPAYAGGTDAFVAKYDRAGALVWLTYLGGSASDVAFGLDADDTGRVWVTGRTSSTDFPTAHPLQDAISGTACQGEPCSDAFLTALDPAGRLVSSTYLGGTGSEEGLAVAVARDGTATLTGNTTSQDFPTRRAFRRAPAGIPCPEGLPCPGDVFASRVAPSGKRLLWSTYLGGGSSDLAGGVAVTDDGGAVLTGSTRSLDFPTRRALQPDIAGRRCGPPPGTACTDLYVTRLSSRGRPVWSTYFGGTGSETGGSVAVDAGGNVHLAGSTSSRDLPVRRAVQERLGNSGCDQAEPLVELCDDAFLTVLDRSGRSLRASTYLGGAAQDSGLGVAVTADGRTAVTGSTDSPDFPTAPGSGSAFGGVTDAFLVTLTSEAAISTARLLGGTEAERANAVALDATGTATLVGRTESTDFPLRSPAQPAHAGDLDAFLTRLP